MAKKTGVFICTGCGIGEAIDTAKLAKASKPPAQVHAALCSPEGLEAIRAEGADTIVIGACSPRMKVFDFPHQRVNLREHVAWCHEPRHSDTHALAMDAMRMGVARAQKAAEPQPLSEQISRRLLVLGQDVAADAAAEAAQAAGYDVLRLDSAARIEGQPGMFDVAVNGGAERVGAIVLATGSKPYDASKLPGYGLPGVVTADELGEVTGDVLFVQCAGSRDPGHLPYCSATCCTRTLEQAVGIRRKDPEANVYIIYKDTGSTAAS
ncbi:MAG: heterodisulfide reductase subunit A, partial [Acidobacteria bacterium]|nr:heterodisulfide reductase subunit A [Acidobacteriota bacterium]